MISFTIQNKCINVFPGSDPGSPEVCLNTFGEEGQQVHEELQNMGCPDLTLISVSNLDWNHDMTPWAIPPVFKKGDPFTGGADDYLSLLLHEILPAAEKSLPGAPAWRGIAGYSLGGLFAVYSICRTGVFSRVASMSGSLWFPGIKEYLFSHEPVTRPEHMYFSLGNKECRTGNKILKEVQNHTEDIEMFYKNQGIDTLFTLNPGNHYQDAVRRSAAGIAWILNR